MEAGPQAPIYTLGWPITVSRGNDVVALGISEFTFGFAFLFEQTRAHWGNLRIAPILPSLWAENDRGWDANLPVNGTDFYYQFKLSDFMVRPTAAHWRDGPYQGPYFRIRLHKHDQNKQHRLLRALSAVSPETYYVAPETNSEDAFNLAFLAGTVTNSSRMIPLVDCEEIHDGDQHDITYQLGDPAWTFHSKPSRHEKSVAGKDLTGHYQGTRGKWRRIDDEFASALFRSASETVLRTRERQAPFEGPEEELLDFDPENRKRTDVIGRTARVLSAFFGVTLVIVGE